MASRRVWRFNRTSLIAFSVALSWVAFAASCSAPKPRIGADGGDDLPGVGSSPNTTDDISGSGASGGFDDLVAAGGGTVIPGGSSDAFPRDPILADATITGDAVSVFANPDDFTAGAVCVHEPHLSDGKGPGALFPSNWLRPRFRWTGSDTLWEIRLDAASQTNDLVVYTRSTEWVMPKDLWNTIAANVFDEITVTIRGSSKAGQRGTFRVSKALAGGSMVFWGTSSSVPGKGTSRLYGFTMGDEAVVNTLDTDQIQSIDRVYTAVGSDLRGDFARDAVTGFATGEAQCIGCHSSTPDGKAMIFTDNYPWNMGIASVETATPGAVPDYVSAGARQFLKMPFLGTGMMLPSAWASGDRTLITTMGRRADANPAYLYINYGYNQPATYEPNVHDLIWIDLQTTATVPDTLPAGEGAPAAPWPDDYWSGQARVDAAAARGDAILAAKGTAWGVLVSDTQSISNPTPAKNSLQIAYSVSESSFDGHPDWHSNTADIKVATLTSPRATATGAPLAGASDPSALEYYPAFSPDDKFIAFTRAPAPSNTSRCAQGKPTVRTNKDSPVCSNPSAAQLGANPDGPYYNRNGEIYVVPAAGGTPHRMRGNDPVMCGGQVSPGVINSWPKWSSAVRDVDGKIYYFVIFSSGRAYPDQFDLTPTEFTPPISTKSSQLYMSVLEYDPATQALTSYGAIYLWNQNYLATGPDTFEPLKTANLTPAWEDFTIPAVPPVEVFK
jgi:WD40-like Beta Propeller Repeat